MLVLPWHLTERLPSLVATLPLDATEVHGNPGRSGDEWRDLVGVYAEMVDAVAGAEDVTVLSGDCLTVLAVIAGVQRKGIDPCLVWLDAHGDFHTEQSTTSGYLGGMPLAKAVGLGGTVLTSALGLSPIPERRAVLVDARELDPPEVENLARSDVRRVTIWELQEAVLPDSPVLLHVDLDILDPSELPGLRFPASGGPSLDQVAAAVRGVADSRSLAGLSIAATWRPEDGDRAAADRVLGAVLTAAGRHAP